MGRRVIFSPPGAVVQQAETLCEGQCRAVTRITSWLTAASSSSVRTPFSRSQRAANSMKSRAVVRVSPSARCAASTGRPSFAASAPSDLLPGPNNPRARPSESTIGFRSAGAFASLNRWSRNGRSNGALWNTSGRSAHAVRSRRPASAAFGAPETIASVMPCTRVASTGIGRPGSMSVDHSSPSAPSRIVTRATSTSRWPYAGLMPVVSVSTASTSWPASRLIAAARRAVSPAGRSGRARVLLPTLAPVHVAVADEAHELHELVRGQVAGDVHHVRAVGLEEDRGRVARDLEAAGQRARGERASRIAHALGALGVEPHHDEVLVQVLAHVRARVDVAVHALTPAAPVRVDVHDHRLVAAGGGGQPFVPAAPGHGSGRGGGREERDEEHRGHGGEPHGISGHGSGHKRITLTVDRVLERLRRPRRIEPHAGELAASELPRVHDRRGAERVAPRTRDARRLVDVTREHEPWL